MNMLKWIAAIVALGVLTAFAYMPQDPLRVGPGIYNLKLDNDRVRVFVVKFAPGQSIDVHAHPDHVVYAVKGGRLMMHEVGKDPMTMDVATGATLFLPAQSHSAKNVGKTLMKLVVVELK
ncbi:MAG: cupin domain-containing protein [Armatimonadetes bacterium]|nr:cupin domain-containing protein [Armatimonadota bacterium]